MRYYLIGIFIALVLIVLTAIGFAVQRHNQPVPLPLPTRKASSPALIKTVFVTYACTPEPCWHGLRPGLTTREQARAIVQEDPAITNVVDGPVRF